MCVDVVYQQDGVASLEWMSRKSDTRFQCCKEERGTLVKKGNI